MRRDTHPLFRKKYKNYITLKKCKNHITVKKCYEKWSCPTTLLTPLGLTLREWTNRKNNLGLSFLQVNPKWYVNNYLLFCFLWIISFFSKLYFCHRLLTAQMKCCFDSFAADDADVYSISFGGDLLWGSDKCNNALPKENAVIIKIIIILEILAICTPKFVNDWLISSSGSC